MKISEILALMLVVCIYAIIRSYGSLETDGISPASALIRKFEATIFESEFDYYKPERIYRWESAVVIHADGKSAQYYAAFLEDTASELSCLTGLDVYFISEIRQSLQPNFLVFLAPRAELAEKLSSVSYAKEFVERRKPTGYGIAGGDGIELKAAVAVIADDAPDHKVRNTLLEEITQAFGPINDTEIVQPSIWSDTGPDIDYLPLNDQIILRALYDPAIRPGMSKDEAMDVARRIIPDLVDAARHGGETALYQRDDCGKLDR